MRRPTRPHLNNISAEDAADIDNLWEQECRPYILATQAHPKRREFDSLRSLGEKLRFDPYLFMDVCFLDRRTTPNVLRFHNVHADVVTRVSASVSLLHVRSVTHGRRAQRTLLMGLDIDELSRQGGMSTRMGRVRTKSTQPQGKKEEDV